MCHLGQSEHQMKWDTYSISCNEQFRGFHHHDRLPVLLPWQLEVPSPLGHDGSTLQVARPSGLGKDVSRHEKGPSVARGNIVCLVKWLKRCNG